MVATKAANKENYLSLAGEAYYYTDNKTFEFFGIKDGRNVNHYSSILYDNKHEWASGAGLLATPKKGENYGDMPATFIYINDGNIPQNTTISLSNVGEITILEECSGLEWDSKTGLVTGKVGEERRPVYYSGNSLATIPVGTNEVSLESPAGGVLKYNYWYY